MIPEGITVSDACRMMSARKVDVVLLTDSNAILSGIVIDKDIATRVIVEELRPEQTAVSKIMTRHPILVNSDSLAIEALEKMVQGKFRHLPIAENGEVIALLDFTKCLYDAISRMEKVAEHGSAIVATVEGAERQWESNFSAPYSFIEMLREWMFKLALSTIISENTKVAIVSPSDPISVAATKMREYRVNSVISMTGIQIQGILTSKGILMRVFGLWTLGIRCNAGQRCDFLDPSDCCICEVGSKEATFRTLGMQQTSHLLFLYYLAQSAVCMC